MTQYETLWSYDGPNAGFLSIKRMAEERGLSLDDKEIRRLENEMTYQGVAWLVKHFNTLK